ncbi:MAG: hypothetical protein IM638_08380 [Bacteroidetes bacterium]|nr:hypothetical protein [Bacteroidota bacterium]
MHGLIQRSLAAILLLLFCALQVQLSAAQVSKLPQLKQNGFNAAHSQTNTNGGFEFLTDTEDYENEEHLEAVQTLPVLELFYLLLAPAPHTPVAWVCRNEITAGAVPLFVAQQNFRI